VTTVTRRTLVGTTDQLTNNRRITVVVDGREIVVFRHRERLYAFRNICPHLGGPVAEGKLAPRVEAVVDDEGAVVGERFDTSEWRVACPWHGFEFRLDDGVCVGDPRYRLRPVEVESEGENIYVIGA
jgi:nitrite reductase (NADH) small subunit